MKKLSAWILLLVFIFPVGLTIGYLKYQQIKVRQEIKTSIICGRIQSSELLVVLSFHQDQINQKVNWIDEKEFSFNGEMYDIITSRKSNDSIYLTCWPDNKESQINQQLQSLVNQSIHQNPQRNAHKNQLISFLKSWFLERIPENYPLIDVGTMEFPLEQNEVFESVILESTTPPPRFC